MRCCCGTDVPLLTLTGTGGVGKTRLALARRRRGRGRVSPTGSCFVGLAPLARPGPRPADGRPGARGARRGGRDRFASAWVALLRPRGTCCWCSTTWSTWSRRHRWSPSCWRRCPHLTVLATSRVVLRLSGEHDVPGRRRWRCPTGVPTARPRRPGRHRRVAPLRRAGAGGRARLRPDDRECGEQWPRSAARLDGLPLAIELAAARIDAAAAGGAAGAAWSDRLRLLTGGARDQPAGTRRCATPSPGVTTLLTWKQQTLFRRLAVFAGGFTLEAAEAVGGKGTPGADDGAGKGRYDRRPEPAFRPITVLDDLSALVDQSLVHQVAGQSPEEPRYRMLETIREFGLERLNERPAESEDAHRAHADHYSRLAMQAEPALTSPNQVAWFTQLEIESPNLRAALTWLIEQDRATALRMAGALIRFWDHHSHVSEGQRWLDAVLAESDDLDLRRHEPKRFGG